MTKTELIQRIENGRDIMFDVLKRHFTILTWLSDGIGIDEQHPNEKGMCYFKTAEDLVEQYCINGIPLGNMAQNIVITDYS